MSEISKIEENIIKDLRKKMSELTLDKSKPRIDQDIKTSAENLYKWVKEFNMFLDILYLNFLGPKKKLEKLMAEQTPAFDPFQINITTKVKLMTPEFEDTFQQFTAFSTLFVEQSKKALNIIESTLKEFVARIEAMERGL